MLRQSLFPESHQLLNIINRDTAGTHVLKITLLNTLLTQHFTYKKIKHANSQNRCNWHMQTPLTI